LWGGLRRSPLDTGPMAVEVVESCVVGKDPGRDCEDVLVETDAFVAVIDGATDETGAIFGGRSGGRFAADVIAATIRTLPSSATAREFADQMTSKLREAIRREAGELDGSTRWPVASVACLSAYRRQVWRIGDCSLAVGDRVYPGAKRVDDASYGFRAVVNAALLESGVDLETVLVEDPGARFSKPLYDLQQHLANTTGPWGYGCVNGTPVPDEHVEIFDIAANVEEVVLASDGYPEVAASLVETERRLTELLEEDPAAIGALWKIGKSLKPGAAGPDDRAYVRVRFA
jgi:hypothetical protein